MNNIDHSLLQQSTSSNTHAVGNDKMAYKNYWSFKAKWKMVRWYGGSFARSWTLLLASGNYYLVRHQKITNMSNVSFGHTWLLTCTYLLPRVYESVGSLNGTLMFDSHPFSTCKWHIMPCSRIDACESPYFWNKILAFNSSRVYAGQQAPQQRYLCITHPSTHHPRILDVIDHLVSPENHVGVLAAQTLGMDLATTIVVLGTNHFYVQ